MAKRKQRRAKKKEEPEKQVPITNDPWISQRSGLTIMGVLSLVLAVYIAWQLIPSEGLVRSVLWGLGFGAAIWGVFGLSLAFNKFFRRKSQ